MKHRTSTFCDIFIPTQQKSVARLPGLFTNNSPSMAGINFLAEATGESTVTPLALRRALAPFGDPVSCTPRSDGTVSVKFRSPPVNLPCSLTTATGPVTIKPTASRSWAAKGTIYSAELIGCKVEDLVGELGEQVVECIAMKTRNRAEGSGRFLLTFSGSVPESVTLNCGLILSVRQHMPAPLRCYNCFEYTHHGSTCAPEKRICPQCGLSFHGDICEAPPKCAACSLPHKVTSPECSVWQREFEIKRTSALEGISFAAAKERYKQRQTPSVTATQLPTAAFPVLPAKTLPGKSYAAALGRNTPQVADEIRTPNVPIADHPMEKFMEAFMLLQSSIAAQNSLLSQIISQNQFIIDRLTAPENPAQPPKRRRAHSSSAAGPSQRVDVMFRSAEQKLGTPAVRPDPICEPHPQIQVLSEVEEN